MEEKEKSAMQEMIDWCENLETSKLRGGKTANLILNAVKQKAIELRDKEKEQIKSAWYNGCLSESGLNKITSSEQYYNDKYETN